MRKLAFVLCILLVITNLIMAQNHDLQQIANTIGEKYAPDKRVAVYDVKVTQHSYAIILSGETSEVAAYNEVLSHMKSYTSRIEDNINILPDKDLGAETRGIIYNSTGNVYSKNAHSAELVTQVLLGMPVKILDQKGGWRRIQMPDSYIGWINGSVEPVTEKELQEYLQKSKIVITSHSTSSYSRAKTNSETVSDLVAGDILVLLGTKGKYYKVVYPDGRTAYVNKSDAKEESRWLTDIELTHESIISTAKQMMGIPYVWGGTSTKGLDCSGFTKTVYFLHGIILARDASQQVKYGELVDQEGSFDKLQPGDLVFFGTKATPENPQEKVVHVGISLGNNKFIHASDYIRINSFDPSDPLYDEFNTKRYLRTKRVIGSVNTPGIQEIYHSTLYQRKENDTKQTSIH
ncbi:MAG: NlpC/P60 family protein [Dysgonamonadaceae bacterium]|jgi:cell wall-associated NlpC family hydrolase|nr:NlpC/P60 family protein [Dysgonamonadaceae bacterium]MDD3901010.1 NlpC/P60 family protein [Dysgonamonadaceae bacterium]MDD4399192.1 NlpC/P60 family protein [Dysgonamonadaceae bacterium]